MTKERRDAIVVVICSAVTCAALQMSGHGPHTLATVASGFAGGWMLNEVWRRP